MLEILAVLMMTHITIISVTVFLHRAQAHRAVELHLAVSHFFRFWLWLTTGMVTKEWVAIHRKHHRYSDVTGDPHSPRVFGIWKVLFQGAWLYNAAAKDRVMVTTYGIGTPDDWLERNIYTPYSRLGIGILFLFNIAVWGWVGALMWLVQMAWIPFWAAGVINGVAHWCGYRNHDTRDHSRNIVPWGIIIGGEELHNNHHNSPASAKLSNRWWEFDAGWFWIRVLETLKLAQVKTA